MDWISVVSDLVVGIIGTMVGLVVGLRVDRWRSLREDRSRDLMSLQELVDRLAGRRAFSHSEDVGLVDDPEDMRRCIKSVLGIRDRIGVTVATLRSSRGAIPVLRGMESDCAAYLNYVEREPLRYAVGLLRLRDRLHESERELKRVFPALEVRRPGDGNDVSLAWLTSA
jgi:hypothetical protein